MWGEARQLTLFSIWQEFAQIIKIDGFPHNLLLCLPVWFHMAVHHKTPSWLPSVKWFVIYIIVMISSSFSHLQNNNPQVFLETEVYSMSRTYTITTTAHDNLRHPIGY